MMAAYFIVRCKYYDLDDYKKYAKAAADAVKHFGGRFLVTGKGDQIQKESGEYPKTVIVEFETMEVANACYECEVYQEALSYIEHSADRDFVIAQGLELT